MPIAGSKLNKLVQLTDPFKYEVLAVFGDLKGRAIVMKPVATPTSIFLAFRG